MKAIFALLTLILLGTSTYAQKGLFEFYVGMDEEAAMKILEASESKLLESEDYRQQLSYDMLGVSVSQFYYVEIQKYNCTLIGVVSFNNGKVSSFVVGAEAFKGKGNDDSCENESIKSSIINLLNENYGEARVDVRNDVVYRKWDGGEISVLLCYALAGPTVYFAPKLKEKTYKNYIKSSSERLERGKAKTPEQITKELKMVKLGMTEKKVRKKLGEPLVDETILGKKLMHYGAYSIILKNGKVTTINVFDEGVDHLEQEVYDDEELEGEVKNVKLGMTEEEVKKILGEPIMNMTIMDEQIMKYGEWAIILVDGKVTAVEIASDLE